MPVAVAAASVAPAGTAAADDVCAQGLVTGAALSAAQETGGCLPYPYGVHCRSADGGLDPGLHVWLVVCVPR